MMFCFFPCNVVNVVLQFPLIVADCMRSAGDLVAVEESQPDNIDGLINVRKRRLLGDVIRELQRHQATRYCFADAPPVRDFIADLSARILDEDECYRLSCQIEPRDRREPVSRSANLQRILASNPALQSEVTKEMRVTMRRGTQPDKDRPPSLPPHVQAPVPAPVPTSAAAAVEDAARAVTTPAAALVRLGYCISSPHYINSLVDSCQRRHSRGSGASTPRARRRGARSCQHALCRFCC